MPRHARLPALILGLDVAALDGVLSAAGAAPLTQGKVAFAFAALLDRFGVFAPARGAFSVFKSDGHKMM